MNLALSKNSSTKAGSLARGGGLYSTKDRSAFISGCSAGKVLIFPVLGSLSVSWSSSRGSAGIVMTWSCLQQTENQRQHRVYFTRSVKQKHNKRGDTHSLPAPRRACKWISTKQFIHHPNAKPRGNSQEPPARASEPPCNAVLYFQPVPQ